MKVSLDQMVNQTAMEDMLTRLRRTLAIGTKVYPMELDGTLSTKKVQQMHLLLDYVVNKPNVMVVKLEVVAIP